MSALIVAFCISSCIIFLLAQPASSIYSLAPYAYWSKVFPNTNMPDAIKTRLPPEKFSEQVRGLNRTISPTHFTTFFPPHRMPYRGLWTADIGVSESDHQHRLTFSRNQSNDTKLFFLEGNLKRGRETSIIMMSHRQSSGSVFLHPEESQAIPFSSAKLDTILRFFSIDAGSRDALIMKETLVDCERPPIKGEAKRCATTLESMIDFVISQLGTKGVHVLSSSIVNEHLMIEDGVYKVRISGVRMISEKAVACHELAYPYAVFYCHKLRNTKSYMVSLIDQDDGRDRRMNAIAMCHHDTTHWNPGHASFQMLGVKPGKVGICHFLEEGFAWVTGS